MEAFLWAVRELQSKPGEVWTAAVHHDDGCPAIGRGPITVCTCEIIEIVARRAA